MKSITSFPPVFILAITAVLSTACREAQSATATYEVQGMTCDACAANIETSVGKMDGVIAVDASYKDGKCVVTYDAAKVKPAAIEAVVDGMGYPADLSADFDEPQKR